MKVYGWIFLSFLALGLLMCTNEQNQDDAAETGSQEVTDGKTEDTKSGKEILDDLRARSLAEDDIGGRLQASLRLLQEAYKTSEETMPTLDNVRLEATEDCKLTIYNDAGGQRKTVVDLSRLDLQAMSLIPDNTPEEFPGLRISVQEGEALVEEYEGDKLITRNNEWVIFLTDRPAIERIAPVVVQMVRLCQGNLN